MKKIKKITLPDNVIELAWSDKISFEDIFLKTGLNENEVIKIMRKELKVSSFQNWRERVSGRKGKHLLASRLKDMITQTRPTKF